MRIAIGALLFEGNTLSPVVNELIDFQNKYCEDGPQLVARLRGQGVEMSGAIAVLEAEGVEIVPLFASHGGAGGRVSAGAWRELKTRLLEPLRAAGEVDGVYLALHGAMVCQGEDDPEGAILEEARAIVGSVPIAVSTDLHAHVTRRMAELATFIVAYQLYPHDDVRETGERSARMLVDTLRGRVRPVMRVRKAPMIVPAPKQRTHGDTPMADFYRQARAREAAGEVLCASYLPVQPWMDFPDVGFTAAVITDDDPALADAIAKEMVREAWRRRAEFAVPLYTPQEAIRRGMEVGAGPVILSDTADCVGGGGSGDSAVVLRALLDAGLDVPATILIVDAETVRQAQTTGVGRRFAARIGNKLNPVYGPPVEAQAEVARLFEGRFTYTGGILAGGEATMGPSALLRVGAVRVVVSTHSSYEYADEQFLAAGVDPRACRFVVVKNPINAQTAYADAPAMFILDTPGPTSCNLVALPWQRISRPRYPLDDGFAPDFA